MSQQRHGDTRTRWRYVEPNWRSGSLDGLPDAFVHLKDMLSLDEYGRMVREYRTGQREVRIENGFVVTTFTPVET
jgi:hypothetical protein